jgi:hypothetical protein
MISAQDKISIILTFLMGVVAGGYLYLTGFATTFEPPEASVADVYTQFVITAESYGQCESDDTCLSFQVLQNGSFRAIYDGLGETTSKDGRIPLSLRGDLYDTLTPTSLALASKTLTKANCQYEGTNYRFEVTRDEVEYVINTCSSAISYESEEWAVLAKLWNHMGNLEW